MAKIVFMGTPDFALPSLRGLLKTQQVIAVVTQPDRPAGRRRKMRASPVKLLAQEAGIPLHQPTRIGSDESLRWLRRLDADAIVVAAFGQILPQRILDLPRLGAINVHASLLPRWRGAAPIQAAIKAGDPVTGATIMLMDAGLDTGAILSQRETAIGSDETGASLHDKLAALGADLLVETLPGFFSGDIHATPQDDADATYAPSIKREEGQINWQLNAAEIERTARAYTPYPGSFTSWKGSVLKIHGGFVKAGKAAPGQVVMREGVVAIGAGDALYCPTIVQLAGKRRSAIADFVNGYGDFVGAQLH